LETTDKTAVSDHEIWHLPAFLRKYFSDRSKSKKLTDNVVRCPTADKLGGQRAHYSDADAARAFTYALNNNRDRGNLNDQRWFGTDPEMYFGWPDSYYASGTPDANNRFPVNANAPEYAFPKKISKVKQHGREWAIGDAFCYTKENAPIKAGKNATRKEGDWMLGTYQNRRWVDVYMTQSPLPRAPYHDKGVNVLMFDGHTEYQRNWTGSVNIKKK
jgi:prepilin-type processing-associated H-X9-DG protein